jgi:hypothetical protein
MDFFSAPFGCRFNGYGELFGCRLVAVFDPMVAVWLPFGCRFVLKLGVLFLYCFVLLWSS